jgi:hypothetical protein
MHESSAPPVVACAEEGAASARGVEGLSRGRLGRCVGLRARHERLRSTRECSPRVGHEGLASAHLRPRACGECLLPLHLRQEVGMSHTAKHCPVLGAQRGVCITQGTEGAEAAYPPPWTGAGGG